MPDSLVIDPPSPHTLEVARQAFLGLQRGAATGYWQDFVDLLAEDVRIMIPVPAGLENPPEGVLRGKDVARAMFASHHEAEVQGARLEAKRVTANGDLVLMECRVEGNLDGELVANHFVFAFEVAEDKIAAMYEYAAWTAKHPSSGWGDVAFAREAFEESIIPLSDSVVAE